MSIVSVNENDELKLYLKEKFCAQYRDWSLYSCTQLSSLSDLTKGNSNSTVITRAPIVATDTIANNNKEKDNVGDQSNLTKENNNKKIKKKKNSNKNKNSKKFNYQSIDIWNHFLSIHCNLIQTQLKAKLIKFAKTTNANVDDIDYLFNKMTISRSICGSLPFKHYLYDYIQFIPKLGDYISMIKYFFDEKENIILWKYCIIYNGIVNMLISWPHLDDFKSDKKVKKKKQQTISFKFNENTNLFDFCFQYLIHQIACTSIFWYIY